MKDMLSDKIWMELIIESKFIGATVEEESENNGNGMRTFIATIQNIHFPLNSDTAAAASTTTSVTTSLCNEDKVSDEDKVVSSEKLDDKQLWLNLALPSTTHIQGYESLIGASVNVVFSLATLRVISPPSPPPFPPLSLTMYLHTFFQYVLMIPFLNYECYFNFHLFM